MCGTSFSLHTYETESLFAFKHVKKCITDMILLVVTVLSGVHVC